MPQKKQSLPSSGTATASETAGSTRETSAEVSNSDQQEGLRGKEGTDAGLANYETALGGWLGAELYGAVSPHLTLESLSGVATDGLSSALEGLVGALNGVDGEVDKDAVKKFGKALGEMYGPLAGKWMESSGGQALAGSLGGWVDAHPKTIVTVALLAAAGAIAADMDIPTLKQKLKITDELSASLEANLGSLRGIALEEIKAQLAYSSGPLMAAIEVSGGADKDVSAKASVSAGDEDMNISADATFTKDGLDLYGVHGIAKTDYGDLKGDATAASGKDPVIKVSLVTQDGDVTNTKSVDYDANSGIMKIRDANSFMIDEDSNTKLDTSVEHSSDGTDTATMSMGTNLDENTRLTGGLTQSVNGDKEDNTKFTGGLTHESDGLKYGANGWLDNGGSGGLSGSIDKDWGNGFKAGGNANYGFGTKDSFSAGGYLEHIDKEGDRLKGSYDYNSENNAHKVDLFAEETLSDEWKVRGQGGFESSDKGKKLDLSLQGAYFFNKDVAGIAGGRYELDERGQSNWIPEVGMQVKGVPIMVSHDFKTNTTSVGITFRF